MQYHRLVKTTPKPKATKNRSGEFVGPPPPPPLPSSVGVGVGAAVVVVAMVEATIEERSEA